MAFLFIKNNFAKLKLKSNFLISPIFNTHIKSYQLITICNYITHHKKDESKVSNEITKIRNIGVIAHVDAGKTTTTERMLYYSGFTSNIGNVDDGNTVMDYMDEERERGITIQSAAIAFEWKDHQFNLIDTPGHVDFTIEVERALRVLDGAVAIVDASAGVEAQTMTVWRQSEKYEIPRIVFINKMDKSGANFNKCVRSIEKKLKTIALPLQMPIHNENRVFIGVVDLINMQKLTWNNSNNSKNNMGRSFDIKNIDIGDEIYSNAIKERTKLIETVAQVNEQFAEILLEKYDLDCESFDDNILLESYIRSTNLNCDITPVLCGSSFKNISVQPMMDAIIKYLPNPLELEKNNYSKYYNDKLSGVCFKILHDHQKSRKKINSATSTAALKTNTSNVLNRSKKDAENEDILSFVRVYSGELVSKSKIYNVNNLERETCDKIYIPYANQLKQVNRLTNGNIGIVSGLTKTITGDTLVSSQKAYQNAKELFSQDTSLNKGMMLGNLDVAQPVYFCTVEPASEAEEKRLNYALECLQREDPSLRVLLNDEDNFGQTTIQGMGELHLEIVKNRILKEYKLTAYFGPLNIAYKEKPTANVQESFNLERNSGDKKITVKLDLELNVKKNFQFDNVILDIRDKVNSMQEIPIEYVNAINHGIKSALNKGVLLRYPIIDTEVSLTSFNANNGVQIPFISTAAYQCTMNALKNADCSIIQPVMFVEVITTKEFTHGVYGDLSRRNATNLKIYEDSDQINISAIVPLAKLSSYSSDIRRITSGNATFSIEFDSYEQISQREYQELMEKKS